MATQFPNLLDHLLAAEAKDKPENKNKKEDSPGGVPVLSVDVSAALALAPIPRPPGGESASPAKEDRAGEVHASGAAPASTESAAVATVGVPTVAAELLSPEMHADALSVALAGNLGGTPENPKALSDDKPAVAPPADTASGAKPRGLGPSVKIQEESPKPPEPVTGGQNQAAAPSPPSPDGELDSRFFAEATETALEDAAAPPASRQTEQREAALSRPEPMTSTVSAPGTKTLAFAARLIPIEKAPASPDPGAPSRTEPTRAASAPGPPAVPEMALHELAVDTSRSNAAAPGGAARTPRAVPDAAADHEPKRPDHGAPAQPAMRAETALAASVPVRVGEAAPVRTDRATGTAEAHRVEVPQPSEPALPASPVRDIRLQVGGEGHVDVRVTERGGEVQVAVRTPDSRLAGVLRDELPALSARLEQSGFRAETWHPDALRVEHAVRSSEPSSPGTPSDGRQTGQQGGRKDDEAPPRRAPIPNTERGGDAPPKEFSWIFSSLR